MYLKVETIENGYRIFFNNNLLKEIDWLDKNDVIEKITLFFKRIINYYNLNLEGFYKVNVYPNKACVIMVVTLIDDYSYNDNNLDFRIIVYLNKKIYFRTIHYDSISCFPEIFYDDEFFYVDLNLICDNFIYYCEFGEIIFDNDLKLKSIKKD